MTMNLVELIAEKKVTENKLHFFVCESSELNIIFQAHLREKTPHLSRL